MKKSPYKLLLLSAVDGAFSFKVRVMWRTLRLFGVHKHTARIVSRYERLIAQYPIADSALWCNHGNWQGKLEYAPREQYGDGAWASFAGLRVI